MMIVTDKQKVVMKRAAFRHLVERGVHTEEELYFVFREILGMKIPTEVCCDNHQPLWGAVTDDFFHRTSKQLIQHCRGGGKTNVVGATKSAKLIFYPGLRVTNFAATEEQGKNLYRYVEGFLGASGDPEVRRLAQKVEGSLVVMQPRDVAGRSKQESARMQVIVGTIKGVNSAHVDDLVQDERALMEDTVAKESMGMLTPSAPYPGVLTVLSTVKQAGDGMDRLVQNADSLGYKSYISCVLDVTNCQETNCNTCKNTYAYSADRTERKSFFDYCDGRILGRNLGHFSVPAARTKFQEMGLENSKSQLFCLEPTGEETAFPGFSKLHNVADLDHYVEGMPFYVFGDFGKADASAFLKAYSLLSPIVYVSDEIIATGKTIQEWIPVLKQRQFSQASLWLVDVAGRATTITSKKSAIDYLKDEGWRVASKKMDEVETTERLRELINRDIAQVVFHPRCKKSIESFERATNKSVGTGDDKIFEKVIKHNKWSHAVDATRYGTCLISPSDHKPGPTSYKIGKSKHTRR